MTSTNALEFQSSKWTRFSTATTVTIGTLTMALTCLLYLVSAFCWGSFQVTTASGDNCHAEFYMQWSFNHSIQHIKITSNGALIGPMFISASLWSSLVGVVHHGVLPLPSLQQYNPL